MLTKLFNRIRSNRVMDSVVNTISTTDTTSSGFLYSVSLPGQAEVKLRAKNQKEVKALVREAQGFTRLPAGTTVKRVG